MASRENPSPAAALQITMSRLLSFLTLTCLLLALNVNSQVLTPPYFNLAQGRNISATATCGEDVPYPELFCRLTGATGSEDQTTREVIRGQLCDYCNPGVGQQDHRPEFATDGTERWWQSPPLSRGVQYNQVNLTVHLGQVWICFDLIEETVGFMGMNERVCVRACMCGRLNVCMYVCVCVCVRERVCLFVGWLLNVPATG